MRGSSDGGRSVVFATSNRGKLEEARVILAPFGISVVRFDAKGVEIQADSTSEVAAYASKGAAKTAGKAVLVEDAGLYVESLGGFPGPYSAYAFRTIGVAGIIALLQPSPQKRTAEFVSSLAYCEPLGEPALFGGRARGTITTEPRGRKGFGFDPIFVPDGGRKTFGELTMDEKCAVSHRADSLNKFAKWYLSRDRR
jgi:XTP/dITP diphosphohydrolase